MKNIGIIMLLLAASAFTSKPTQVEPQSKQITANVETIVILTSAVCEECKERIEKELNYTKGVVFAELDIDTKKITVKYKTKTITADGVKKVINNLGYDADNSKRNEEAFNKLPKCCQSAGHCTRN